ncbi:MAG: hypothetical protein M5U34_15325 [Chloroflexi bacterium]|nr:hypothetical protein [Chloroflexota bacterium]
MANYYTELAPNQVRRADREVTDETWLKALLHRGRWVIWRRCRGNGRFPYPDRAVERQEKGSRR